MNSFVNLISYFGPQNALCGFDASNYVYQVCGFKGSSAIVFSGESIKTIFVDPRYTLQAKKECFGFEVIECKNLHFDCEEIKNWYEEKISCGLKKIYFDPNNISLNQIENIKQNFFKIDFDEKKFIKQIFKKPSIEEYEKKYEGSCFHEKRNLLLEKISLNYDTENFAFLITSPKSIAWLFNLRVKKDDWIHSCSPTFPSIALITKKESLLVVDAKLPSDIKVFENVKILESDINFFNENICDFIDYKKIKNVLFNKNQISKSIYDSIKDLECNLIEVKDFCLDLRNKKNKTEIENIKKIQKIESVAIIKLMNWLEHQDNINEFEISEKLEEFRNSSNLYQGKSFSSIIANGENSAIIHYQPNNINSKIIDKEKVLLMDVGGHYLGGTTDMTRTIWLSKKNPSEEISYIYTLILKGHIALANAIFPIETTGKQLDILARQFLWKNLKNYPHGTGHGISNYLAVHDCSIAISSYYDGAGFEDGCLVSNEPGFYIENNFGIRLENIMLSKKVNDDFLCFEVITKVPFDCNLINFQMLNEEEKKWLIDYHESILNDLNNNLDNELKNWLIDRVKKFYD